MEKHDRSHSRDKSAYVLWRSTSQSRGGCIRGSAVLYVYVIIYVVTCVLCIHRFEILASRQ